MEFTATPFAFLPPLTYGRALSIIVLWGGLFVIVLAMISGARELMTPAPWDSTLFLMLDGGVRTIDHDIDPAVFQQLGGYREQSPAKVW